MTTTQLQAGFIEPAARYEDVIAQQVEKAKEGKSAAFKLRARLLNRGRTETVLAASDGLTVRLKVYASGGENALHAHANEDHTFVILRGSARFYNDEGVLAELGAYEGILLPKAAYYRFHTIGDEPLVMLRVGSPNESALGLDGRVDVRGDFAHADAAKNKTEPVEIADGKFFG